MFWNLQQTAREPVVTFKDALDSGNEGLSSRLNFVLEVALIVSELCSDPLLRKFVRLMVQTEAKYVHAFEMKMSPIKTPKEALSNPFQTGYEETRDGSENASCFFV